MANGSNAKDFFLVVFGPYTPKDRTPKDNIQRLNPIYGATKVSGELLCDYHHKRPGMHTRGFHYPGLIFYVTVPGGGATDDVPGYRRNGTIWEQLKTVCFLRKV